MYGGEISGIASMEIECARRRQELKTSVDTVNEQKEEIDGLEKANAELVKEVYELKKKRTKGEINEAYAKTIEADKEIISYLKVRINRLEQKLSKGG